MIALGSRAWRLTLSSGRVGATVLLALAGSAGPAGALEPGLRFDQYAHMDWPSVAHSADVHDLALSRDGRLWIATSEGLISFDGQRMLGAIGSTGSARHGVDSVIVRGDGSVWIGSTSHGLARVRDGGLQPVGTGVPGGRTQALLEDASGALWIGTSRGLARLLPGAVAATAMAEGLPSQNVRTLLAGRDGHVWVGLQGGLARWDGRGWRVETGLPADITADALWQDADGALWVGSRDHGLWHRQGSGWRQASDGLPAAPILALLRDQASHLWVATRAGLFSRGPTTGAFTRQVLPRASCSERIRAMAEDREGGLWLATDRCGLHRLQDRPFRVFSVADGLPSDNVLAIAAMPDGSVWAGTRGEGIMRWRDSPTGAAPVPCEADLPCRHCWDFSRGGPGPASGTVWMVCAPNKVMRWDGQRLARVAPLGGLASVSFAIETSDGSTWMTLGKQVFRRGADGRLSSIEAQEMLEGSRLLHEGRGGTVWIVADDGVAVWRAGGLEITRLSADEHPAAPANVLEDGAGSLWIATKGEGLRRLRDGRIATVGVLSGLPTGWIVQPLEDDHGRLWMSSSLGIFWVSRQQLDEVADRRRSRLSVNMYDAGDGIQMSGASYGHPAGFKDGRGDLVFASSGGVVVVHPGTLGAPSPAVTFEDVRLDGKRMAGASLPTTTAPRTLDVSFAARSFAAPATISFRYRLVGRDAEWIEVGAVRSAHYAQLGAGEYRLLVEGRVREGSWSAQPAVLVFSLRPPFHRSPLFALACLLAAALAMFAVHRVRLGRTRAAMQAALQERSRLARDLHDTLAQAFVATSVQLECLQEAVENQQQADIQRHLGTARKVVAETLDEARRAVWVLRPQTLDRGLTAALSTLVGRVSGGVSVAFDIIGAERVLSPLVASGVLRVAQEAVANARRHGQARQIAVQLSFLPDLLALSVSDDGKGMDEAAPGRDSTGIAGMKQRAADIGATLVIDSVPGRGTTVRLEVPA